ncbi:MAG: cbb3-type cytochrome c oxidase subunit 3 [Rhodoferax sp.]|jgi:cytochrome c oxidase cbb3-type subunit IV|nr:cbb3-type cytochrome c oxidase subunit 3 [Rhodoferax sp.]
MDVNTLRSIATVLSFVAFIGIVVWAYSRSRAAEFEQAANLPFEHDQSPAAGTKNE